MKKLKNGLKNFFDEFKKFITRGNVLDLAVGVIVGGAFTGIVNGLSNYILKPLINWFLSFILGKDGLTGVVTFLSKAYTTDATTGLQVVDLANSIYIDWGAFISAVINFFIIAIVLFSIVRTINKVTEASERARLEMETQKAAVKKYRKSGMKKKQAIAQYREDVRVAAEEAAAKEAAAAAEAARIAEEKAMANTRLLEEIRDILKNK